MKTIVCDACGKNLGTQTWGKPALSDIEFARLLENGISIRITVHFEITQNCDPDVVHICDNCLRSGIIEELQRDNHAIA